MMQATCTRPLWDMLINDTLAWIPCSHAMNAGGVLVVGTFMYAAIATVILNWTESFYPPLAWTALSMGVVGAYLPGDLLMRVLGIVSIAVALGLVTLWQAWRR